jgi:hypothetical protein
VSCTSAAVSRGFRHGELGVSGRRVGICGGGSLGVRHRGRECRWVRAECGHVVASASRRRARGGRAVW